MYRFASIAIDNEIVLTGIKLEIFVGIISNFVTKCHSYIFCTKYVFSGGWDEDAGLYSDVILQFNKETNKFAEVGKLEQRRYKHSISLVNINEYTCAEPPTYPTCNSFDTCITSPNYPDSYPNNADEVK